MPETTLDKELDALKADFEILREEIASLAASVKNFDGSKAAGNHSGGMRATTGEAGPDTGEEGHGVFTDIWHKLDASRIQGEKVIKGLAAEVEQHPLVSVMAAFGLGYIIAKLWYQESKG
jgi:hypothetical protein